MVAVIVGIFVKAFVTWVQDTLIKSKKEHASVMATFVHLSAKHSEVSGHTYICRCSWSAWLNVFRVSLLRFYLCRHSYLL